MIHCAGLSKSYSSLRVLGPVTLRFEAGEQVAIMGPSGAGKTTLLHCLAGIESPDSGEVTFSGSRWSTMSESQKRAVRLRRLGLLFQSPELLPELSLSENVSLPLEFSGVRRGNAVARARELLDRLGIGSLAGRHPYEVSGGEAQRVALARALAARPAAILADEPTGALDTENRDLVLNLMTSSARDVGATLVVVTHDAVVASALDRTVNLIDGHVQDMADVR